MKKSTKSSKSAAPKDKPTAAKRVEAKPARKTVAPRKKAAPQAVETELAPSAAISRPPLAPTSVTAQIDIGYGNTLFIRGDGPGLSWERGQILECVADDKWTITLPASSRPLIFKFLINDLTWSTGSDFILEPGASIVLTPRF